MAVGMHHSAPAKLFLQVATPARWIEQAATSLPVLLNDHANCELKAASTALGFIYRYPERTDLCQRMSRLAREELRHYEQVRSMMSRMDLPFSRLSASRYASALRDRIRGSEPGRLLDSLLVGAIIEARSCERFAALVPVLPPVLSRFYAGLLASEARHFENYLSLARRECTAADDDIDVRLEQLLAIEAALVSLDDDEFRFHSGPVAQGDSAQAGSSRPIDR